MSSQSPSSSRRVYLPTTRSRSPFYELESVRLQRTADTASIQYEQECKRDVLLNEQIRIMEEELRRKKESLLSVQTANAEEKRMRQQIASLTHELHLTAISVAETQTCNQSLRRHIEGCRRDLSNFKYAIHSLTSDIQGTALAATTINFDNCDKSLGEIHKRGRLEQVRCKSVHSRLKQTSRIRELAVSPSQVTMRKEIGKAHTFVTADEDEDRTAPLRRNFDLVDPIPIQRALTSKWHDVRFTQKVTAAKHDLDGYIKHMKRLESSFNTIQSAMGITELDEVVSLIIKSQEQGYNLHMQVNLLNVEAETLEDELRDSRRYITRLRSSQSRGEREASSLIRELSSKVTELQDFIRAKTVHFSEIESRLQESFIPVFVPCIQNMLCIFAAKELHGMLKTQSTTPARLTVGNVMGHLAEAEACIVALTTWQTYVQNSYAGIISDTILKKMSNKRFELSPLSIKSTLADTLISEDDFEEAKTPLHEDEIRNRMRILLSQKPDLTPKSPLDFRRVARTLL